MIMKLTLAETKLLKDSTTIIADIVTEVHFKVTPTAVELIAMDPANVAMVIYKLLSTAFAEYHVAEPVTISVNLNDFKAVLRRIKPADTMTLELADNKFKITLKGASKREFFLPLIDGDEREQKVPNLNFTAVVNTNSDTLSDAIDDADIIGESVTFGASPEGFMVSSASDLSKAIIEMDADANTKIKATAKVQSKYSIEYLKKMVPAGKLVSKVEISFSKDYPLKLEYKLIDKMDLTFILAPRVDND
jgi:proliferating cell nuclear antigen